MVRMTRHHRLPPIRLFCSLNLFMKTLFIVQKRHPNLSRNWPHSEWHDRVESRPDMNQLDAIKEAKSLQSNSDLCEYRVIKRVEETIFTANNQEKENFKK